MSVPPSESLLLDVPVAEHLPGEPVAARHGPLRQVLGLLVFAALVAALFVLTAGLWPLYLLGAAIWGWAPNVPRAAQIRRYVGLAWTAPPPPQGPTTIARLSLLVSIARKCAVIPVWGLAWLMDEALYGRQLREIRVVAPLFEISAARSGSTQLARYIEDDPNLVAPNLLQFIFPYLWLWKLAPRTIGRIFTPDKVRHKLETMMPEAFLQRHEGDPYRTDTFEGALYLAHLNHMATALGPDVIVDDFGMGAIAPHNRHLWEQDFVAIVDGIARKTLLLRGRDKRFFLKGHFLAGADALEKRYPDARFLTMVREPAPRLQSGINFLAAAPSPGAGAAPWSWLGQALVRTEVTYCDNERAWFSRTDGARRCVLRFDHYVRDLEGAMSQVYRECLDTEPLPAYVPRQHPPRERTNYILNRSLAQCGIDEDALNARLAEYRAWIRSL